LIYIPFPFCVANDPYMGETYANKDKDQRYKVTRFLHLKYN